MVSLDIRWYNIQYCSSAFVNMTKVSLCLNTLLHRYYAFQYMYFQSSYRVILCSGNW
jgi:hypothetical protein